MIMYTGFSSLCSGFDGANLLPESSRLFGRGVCAMLFPKVLRSVL